MINTTTSKINNCSKIEEINSYCNQLQRFKRKTLKEGNVVIELTLDNHLQLKNKRGTQYNLSLILGSIVMRATSKEKAHSLARY